MKKLIKRGVIISCIALFSFSIFAWTDYRKLSIDKFISSNVEALTNGGGGDIVYFDPNVTTAYTQNGRLYFVGVTNNIENGVVLPGCSGKGVCETSYPIQDTTAKDKWKDWVDRVKDVLGIVKIATQIKELF